MDLAISSCSLFEHIKGFRVLPQSEMSDHCKIKIIINIDIESPPIQKDDYNWLKHPPCYKWDHSKSDQCKETFDYRCVTEIIQKATDTTLKEETFAVQLNRKIFTFCGNKFLRFTKIQTFCGNKLL